MIDISIAGNKFAIEFRHLSKTGKQPSLESRYPIRAVTTCVVVVNYKYSGNFIAIENAICMESDAFSRNEGRLRALRKVLKRSGALKDHAGSIWREYQRKAGIPQEFWTDLDTGKLPRVAKPKIKFSAEELGAIAAAGRARKSELRNVLVKARQLGVTPQLPESGT